MKKNILLIVAISMLGAVTLTVTKLSAQNQPPAAGAPPAGPVGSQPPRQGFRGRPNMGYRQAIFLLKRAKMDLERSKDDYDGHRQSAMDACDKAVTELEAVQASIQAKAKTAADAAAQQAPAQQPPPAAAPASPAPQQ